MRHPETRFVEGGIELDLLDGDPENLRPVLDVGLDGVREDDPADLPEVREAVFSTVAWPRTIRGTSERTT